MLRSKFKALLIPAMKYKNLKQRFYDIYKDTKESVRIEAESAKAAISKSEVKTPYAIKLTIYYLDAVIHEENLEPGQVIENVDLKAKFPEEYAPKEAAKPAETADKVDAPSTETSSFQEEVEASKPAEAEAVPSRPATDEAPSAAQVETQPKEQSEEAEAKKE